MNTVHHIRLAYVGCAKKTLALIVISSEEARIKVTLIRCDKMSHVKGHRNSCSLTNFAGVE